MSIELKRRSGGRVSAWGLVFCFVLATGGSGMSRIVEGEEGELRAAEKFLAAAGTAARSAEPAGKSKSSLSETPATRLKLERSSRARNLVPVKIVCLGDSVTGVYYHTGGRRAYPEMLEIGLRKLYPDADITVINAGLSGHTAQLGLARLQKDVLRHKPDLVTVMFGLNDMTRSSFDAYRKNLAEIARRCREAGAEVMFCSPNSVLDKGRDAPQPLAKFVRAMEEDARKLKLGYSDCFGAYEAIRTRDYQEYMMRMSDTLHPNMDGHKLTAEVICRAISGRAVSLADVPPSSPALPFTRGLLAKKRPVRVLAMPPYDAWIVEAVRVAAPEAKLEVVAWPIEGKSLADLEKEARSVRGRKFDLVIVAPPPGPIKPFESFHHSMTWILNWSLSFGHQEWDVLAIPPSVAKPGLNASENACDALMRRFIVAQHATHLFREAKDSRDGKALFVEWIQRDLTSRP